MDDSPEDTDLGEYIDEAVTLSRDPKRLIAKKTIKAYTYAKGTIAAAATTTTLALGAMVAGPLPVIATQQEPVKRPDEHIASQSQEEEAVMEAANLEDTLLSVVQVSTSDDLPVRTISKAQVMLDILPPPLPLITAAEPDKPEDSDKAS